VRHLATVYNQLLLLISMCGTLMPLF